MRARTLAALFLAALWALPAYATGPATTHGIAIYQDDTGQHVMDSGISIVPTGPLNIYLSTSGVNNSLCSVAAPCRDVQQAINVCYKQDVNGSDCIINVQNDGAGVYSSVGANLILGPLRGGGTGVLGTRPVVPGGMSGGIIFNGIGNPTITHTGAQCGTIYISNGANVGFTGSLKLQSASACPFGGELVVQDPGSFASIQGGNLTFGCMTEVSGAHINLQQQGLAEVDVNGYKVEACAAGVSASSHAILTTGGSLIYDGNAAIRGVANGGNPVNFGANFYAGQIAGQVNISAGTTFTGFASVNVPQVSLSGNSVVMNFASATNAVPGTTGVAVGGGQYLDANSRNIIAQGIAGQSNYTNPTGTTAGPVMMGLGVGHSIAGATTNRILTTFAGQINNSFAAAGGTITLLYGTGTPPANGAAVPGGATICGGTLSAGNFTTPGAIPFSLPCYVKTTAGTNYWFDIALSSNNVSNTATITNVSSSTIEAN